MITITFEYWSKTDNKYKLGSKEFDDVDSAIKFCWAMQKSCMWLLGYRCIDPEDKEIMDRRVNMSKINMK